MINFAVGPVQSCDEVRNIGSEQVPYFRTPEFSAVMLENERLIKKFAGAGDCSRAVFITGSGTASMEASVINTLTTDDKAIIVNGGSFGHRFADICNIHGIPNSEIRLDSGKALTREMLVPYENAGYTAFLVNVCETSTGVHYDMELISEFCRRNKLFLITDEVSSFLADDYNMDELGADVMITGSQKALACPPGVSVIVLSPRALERISRIDPKCMYLNLHSALSNGERGQTPFTPAVGILLQIHERLKLIEAAGGAEAEIAKTAAIAADLRTKIADFPFEIVSESLSNCVTPFHPLHGSAYDIFMTLKDEYGIWICPNGGELKDKIFRIGHIGEHTTAENDELIRALNDMKARGLL